MWRRVIHIKRLVFLELKKIIRRKEFKLVFIVIWAAIFLDFLLTCREYYGANLSNVMSAFNGTIITNVVKTALEPIVGILLPLTVGIIYSDSYLEEDTWGVSNFINTRISKKNNIIAKSIAISIISFSIIFIPLLANEILAIIAFPIQGYNTFGAPDYKLLCYIDYDKVLPELQLYYPYINILLFIFIRALYGVAFALLSFGVSFLYKVNKYITVLSAFIINTFMIVVLNSISKVLPQNSYIYTLISTDYLSINGYGKFMWILIMLFFYLSISIILIKIGIKSDLFHDKK